MRTFLPPRGPDILLAPLGDLMTLVFALSTFALAVAPARAVVAGQAPAARAAETRSSDVQNPRLADDAVVARAFDVQVTWKDLEPVFLERRADTPEGREALKHLVKTRMLETLAREHGLAIPVAQVDARLAEIEKQMRAAGEKDGLEAHLARRNLTRAEFRTLLELAIVQETLTKRALGKPESDTVNAEQQELWLEETLQERALELIPPPWDSGVAARATGFTVTGKEFLAYLRKSLDPETIREDCFQVLLLRRVLARMPDLAPDKLARCIDEEIELRKAAVARDPKYKGIPWERMLRAQGILPELIRDDPDVRVAALARIWVERSYDEPTLKRIYGEEREHFDSVYGAAIDTRMVFLRAAEVSRDSELRSFKDADAKLVELQRGIHSLEDFQRAAKETSEDANSREHAGSLGYVTAGNPRIPQAVRDVVKRELDLHPTLAASSAGGMFGPVRLPNGSALLWLGARRPVPSWADMVQYLRRELRQRFLDDALPRAKMVDIFGEK